MILYCYSGMRSTVKARRPIWTTRDVPAIPDSRPRRQLADCLDVCEDRSPHGPLVHTWSADRQPRTITLGTGLSCSADYRICRSETICLVRQCPPQTVSYRLNGHDPPPIMMRPLHPQAKATRTQPRLVRLVAAGCCPLVSVSVQVGPDAMSLR